MSTNSTSYLGPNNAYVNQDIIPERHTANLTTGIAGSALLQGQLTAPYYSTQGECNYIAESQQYAYNKHTVQSFSEQLGVRIGQRLDANVAPTRMAPVGDVQCIGYREPSGLLMAATACSTNSNVQPQQQAVNTSYQFA